MSRNDLHLSRRNFLQTSAVASTGLGLASSGTLVSATNQDAVASGETASYKSRWDRLPDRYWIDPQTWANPWEDWAILDGRLVCTKGGGKQRRTVHNLTHQLNDGTGSAEMSVVVSTLAPLEKATGNAGFMIGVQVNDPLDDYRSRLLFGSGMLALLQEDGSLKLGNKTSEPSAMLRSAMLAGQDIRLSCSITPETGNDASEATYAVSMTAEPLNPESSSTAALIVLTGVEASKVVGNIALTADFKLPNSASPQSEVGEDEPGEGVDANPAEVAAEYITVEATPTMPSPGLFGFSDWTIQGTKITATPEQSFGPILWTMYSISRGTLKMTAQMPVLGAEDNQSCELQMQDEDGEWDVVSTADLHPVSRTCLFRIDDWTADQDRLYRVAWTQKYKDGESETFYWDGTVRRDPVEKEELVVAGYCCFTDFLFPNADIARETAKADPDILFFTGDQIYEGVGGWGIIRDGDIDRMFTNYLRKLALVGWSFRDVMRDRPTVWMPDDHDVYHGNVWGAGGRRITLEEWAERTDYENSATVGNRGGYVQPAEFVRAVDRTQTSHLPDPFDPRPIEQGIGVYFTNLTYGRVSFAILEDRKFKSGPLAVYKHESHRPDWIVDRQAALAADVPEAILLGERQLDFLNAWTQDWDGADVKMTVSQTIFANAATHHGGADHFLVADMDSNGWPQTGRNKALDAIRRGHAFMLAGDQHLPTVLQHGIDGPHDAGFSFCTPAGATGYQRWWRPEEIDDMYCYSRRRDDLPQTGLYRDGFGNSIDVWAVGNPPHRRTSTTRLEMGRQKSAGFGLVRVNKREGTFELESWIVGSDVDQPDAEGAMFPGWPITVTVDQMAGTANPKLARIVLQEWNEQATAPDGTVFPIWPVVQILDEDGETVSMVRMTGPEIEPTVFAPRGSYFVRVLLPKRGDEPIAVFGNQRPGGGRDLIVNIPTE